MMTWDNKPFYCRKYGRTALFKNGRQHSLTPRREGHLSTRPFPKLNSSYSSCLRLYFAPHFLRQWLNIPYGKARATWALPSCVYDACHSRHITWRAASSLSKEASQGQAAPPAHLPLALLHCCLCLAGQRT